MGAKKGQLHKTYTNEFKQEVLERMETNQSHESIAREFGVSIKTIENWKYKLNKGINIFGDERLKTQNDNSKPTYEELEQEIDILKKMKKFANSQQNKK